MDHQQAGPQRLYAPPLGETGESSQSGAYREQSFSNPDQANEAAVLTASCRERDLTSDAESLLADLRYLSENNKVETLVGAKMADEMKVILQGMGHQDLFQKAMQTLKAQEEVAQALDTRSPGLLQQCLAVNSQKSAQELDSNRIANITCKECLAELGSGNRFYTCQDCTEPDITTLCLSCFFAPKTHRHDNFICQELYPMGVRQTPIKSRGSWDNAIGKQMPTFDQVQQDIQSIGNDLPISQVLQKYLDDTDLASHRYGEAVNLIRDFPEEPIFNKEVFRTLKNWAITCILIADFDFSQRAESRGQASLMAVLSPAQRVSVRLLKEWWFSEIQNPTFMLKTFAHSLSTSLFPDNDHTRLFISQDKNQYLKDYHGDLYRLFRHEFETLQSGDSLATSQQLELSRQAAANSSCCQRMGQLAWNENRRLSASDLEPAPDMEAPGTNTSIAEATTVFCDQWRRDVTKACGKALITLKMTGAPEVQHMVFWWLLEVIVEGPLLLHKESSLHPDVVLDANGLSSHLQPLAWLADSTRNNDRPYYLWDRRLSKTVETSGLKDPLDYVAISHTWGRWKVEGRVVDLPGVDWKMPMIAFWDVSCLPDYLRGVPGHQRYIWFDLVCIPQGIGKEDALHTIQKAEVAKQAAIFGKATNVVAWLNTMTKHSSEKLHRIISLLAEGSGTFYRSLMHAPPESASNQSEAEGLLSRLGAAIKKGLPKLRGPGGKLLTVMDQVPLAEEELRDRMGKTTDSQEYVNKWFTSLWTLQEACMRPDMWICDKNWDPLRLGSNPCWDHRQNVSLDAIFSLLESSMLDSIPQQESYTSGGKVEAGMDEAQLARFEALLPQLIQRLQSKVISNQHDRKAVWSAFKEELELSGLPVGQLHSWDLGDFDKLHHGAEAASKGQGSNVYSTFDVMKQLPAEACIFRDMLKATGMTRFADLRSRIDIIAIGERRTCKRPKDRAEAIMSAVGVVDWYDPRRTRDDPPLPMILELYPVAFVDELREKAGDADFFRSRTLNKSVLRYFEGGDYTPMGSMLPFSKSPSLDVMLVPSNTLKNSLPVEEHVSLSGWSIGTDGSVQMPTVAVAAKTKNPQMQDAYAKCTIAGHTVIIDGAERGVIATFNGTLHDWLRKEKEIPGTCFLVVLSRQQTTVEKISHSCTSHAVLLRELKPRVLVKIGMFILSGDEMACWPPKTSRNWTVL
ncbi:hypothetical protein ACHAQH_000868 [Verticillium albo-atrum]